ncbi:hypothetical protein RDV89_01065 [Nocardioides zeae]|uniref:EthD domain-containing protein n=1 Tax=Nocardioides imazamoxiresistens TaxID=3231893 RepID=A0ABU3PR01_9ACTN|nr:hypothetical protein [Nocardioides zeae]MDT9591637.1 hypothetical protein [Nocardioides zeae]
MSATTPAASKRILQFQPSALRPREESERHYLEVHSPWAVRVFRDHPGLLAYHTNLVLGQWDIDGGFRRVPDLWRYATMRFGPEGGEFSASVGRMLAHDHQNFLRDLRRFDVTETVVLDRGTGQLSSDKYVVVVDRPERLDPRAAATALEELVARVADAFAEQYGARRLVDNRVLREGENVALAEPGQKPTGRTVEGSRRMAYLELYLDHQVWGEELFAGPALRGLLEDSPFAPDSVTAYHLAERAPHDRR